MYNFIDYSNSCLKTSRVLWQFYRDILALAENSDITDFTEVHATMELFNIKEKLSGQTGNNDAKNVETMVPLKHLSNT